MRTYYAQPFTQSISKEPIREQQIESLSIEAKEPNQQLAKIYESLKNNFKTRNFSLFGEDRISAVPKKKSISRRKLEKLKLPHLPRLPRIKHGDSKSPKKHTKEEQLATLGKTLHRQSSFINRIFRSNSKKRTKSDLVNKSSNKILPIQFTENVMRMTIAMPSRKASMRNFKQPAEVINQRLKDLATTRVFKQLSSKEINLELEALDERQFLNVMRAYNYLKVGVNTLGSYRAYVRPGNNSELIKRCLKARGCWIIVQSQDEGVNFLWSQLRAGHFTKRLESRTLMQLEDPTPTKPIASLNQKLVEEFSMNRISEYPLLATSQTTLDREVFRSYLNKVLNIASRGISKAADYYRLVQVMIRRRPKYSVVDIPNPHTVRLHNHVEGASSIGNKKALLFHMRRYYQQQGHDPFHFIPETVHITGQAARLTEEALKQMLPFGLPCILKPGQFTNRGNGITVHTDWKSLQQALAAIHYGSIVVQRYITPFLYKGRKFDIRVWVLWNGRQAWWYRQGYIRTASKEFSMANTSRFVHLTNDAVQKYSDTYGKHEQGNKISFNQFQRYLDFHEPSCNFWHTVYPEMRRLARDAFRVASVTMDQRKRMFGYELFGLDFLVDAAFKPWLIEANTNPCLETSCTLLTRLVTNMVDNVLSIAVDPLFPPPDNRHRNFNFQSNFKFELLYDAYTDNTDPPLLTERKFEAESDCSDSSEDPLQES